MSAPHRRMHAGDRRQQDPGQRRQADADGDHRGHVGLKRDAERGGHLRVLHPGANHAAERRALQQPPQRGDSGRGQREHHQPVAGVNEVADQHLTSKRRRDRERQRRGAEDQAQGLLGDHRQTKREQQPQGRIGAIEAAKKKALDDQPDERDQPKWAGTTES